MGAGAGHQRLIVIPSLHLIVVRNGASLTGAEKDPWGATERFILAPLAAAVVDLPYPPSRTIRRVRFDDEAAFITRDWGRGDTHGYRLPTKWISPDGREMYLV